MSSRPLGRVRAIRQAKPPEVKLYTSPKVPKSTDGAMAVVGDVKRDPPSTSNGQASSMFQRARLKQTAAGTKRTKKAKSLAMNGRGRTLQRCFADRGKDGVRCYSKQRAGPFQGADGRRNRGHSRDQSKKTHHPCHAALRMQRSRVHESGGEIRPPGTSICFKLVPAVDWGDHKGLHFKPSARPVAGTLRRLHTPVSFFWSLFFFFPLALSLCPAFRLRELRASTRNTSGMQPSQMAKPN